MASNQGVGPHFDSGFLTFVCRGLTSRLPVTTLLTSESRSCCRRQPTMGFRCRTFQANGLTCHPFLEHSLSISARVSAFVPFSCVSAPTVWRISTVGLEMVTYGLTRATSHRVLSPPVGSTPRYSIPFFQNIGQNLRLSEIRLNCMYPFGYGEASSRAAGSSQFHQRSWH